MQKKKRIPTFVKIIIFITIPVLLAVGAFVWVGAYYRDVEKIYPNISISGVDVSWMTREEAIEALWLSQYEQRAASASVSVIFPDDSVFFITGADIGLTTDAADLVNDVFQIGRGNGFISDTFSFIKRLNSNMLFFDIIDVYDSNVIHDRVVDFVDEYNTRLAETEPYLNENIVIITKGAGQEPADSMVMKDIVSMGLFESYETGLPVEVVFVLPEVDTNAWELFLIHNKVYIPMESAVLDQKTLLVSNDVTGVEFNYLSAARYLDDVETGKTATFYIDYIQPETTRADIESLLYRDVLGECTTWVHGSADRVTNVRVAAEAINGLILKPGDEFSFNEVVGQRLWSRGYRMGGAFIGGETVSVIGGGVCQVSSTLYASIVDTEILVTERYQHSRSVPYLPRGRDATVYWDKLDFKFVNNTEYPMRIEFELDDRDLTAWVIGTNIDDFPSPPLPEPED